MPILISPCNTTFAPSTEAFTSGKARRASTQARTKKGMKVSLVSLRFSNSLLAAARSCAMCVMSASSIE